MSYDQPVTPVTAQGETPLSPAPAPTVVVRDRVWWTHRLMRYYTARNLTQATPDQIAIILDRFEKPGQSYNKIWDMLMRKYGPEPSRPVRSTLRDRGDWWADDRLLKYCMVRNPTRRQSNKSSSSWTNLTTYRLVDAQRTPWPQGVH